MTTDEELIVEAWNFGQFADDATWQMPKPVREAMCRLAERISKQEDSERFCRAAWTQGILNPIQAAQLWRMFNDDSVHNHG